MNFRIANLIIIVLPLITFAQFSEDIAIGPSTSISKSQDLSQIRINGRIRIPGDYFDIEADLVSFSALLDKKAFESYGVSWVTLSWVPPLLIGQKVSGFSGVAYVLMGINGVTNANFSIGNDWIRGMVGWKNDFFIWKDFLWVFSPEIGLKCSIPQKWVSDGSFRLGFEFPAMVGTNSEFINHTKQFSPRILIGLDFLIMFAEIYVGGK